MNFIKTITYMAFSAFKKRVKQNFEFHFIFLLSVSFIFSVYLALTLPLYVDEIITYVLFASKGILTSISYYPTTNNHVFHSIITSISVLLPFNKPFLIRLPVLIENVFVIFFSYSFLKEYFNKNFAVISTTLCSFLFMSVHYSFHSRGYGLGFLFFILSTYSAFKITNNYKNPYYWVYFAIANILGLFTMPSFMYSSIPINLFILLSLKKVTKEQIIANLIIILTVLLLYTPIITVNGLNALIANEFIQPQDRALFIKRLPWFIYLTYERIFGFASLLYEPNTALRSAKLAIINIFKQPFPFYSFFITTLDVLMFIYLIILIILIPFLKLENRIKLFLAVFMLTPPFIMYIHSFIPFSRTFAFYAFMLTMLLLFPFKLFITKMNGKLIFFIQLLIMTILIPSYCHLIKIYEVDEIEVKQIVNKVNHSNNVFINSDILFYYLAYDIKVNNNNNNTKITYQIVPVNVDTINKRNFNYVITSKDLDSSKFSKPMYSSERFNVY